MTLLGIVNIVVLLALALFTYFYMKHTGKLSEETRKMAEETRRMADIMTREYEDKVAPLVHLEVNAASHSSSGFRIPCVVSNLGQYPITANELVMEWWYKRVPTKGGSAKQPLGEKLLKKGDSIPASIRLSDDAIKTPEIPETMEHEGFNLGALVAAEIWLEFCDNNQALRQTSARTLDPLAM
jgi:hypothetical protein